MLPYELAHIVRDALLFALSTTAMSLPLETASSVVEDVADTNATAVNAPDFFARILPLGASIVWGTLSSDGNGFRLPIRESLRDVGWNVNMVGSKSHGDMADNNVEAHPGDIIDEVHDAARNSTKFQPNLILIHAGTNDCARNIDVDNAGTRLGNMLDTLYTEIPGTTIILSTLIASSNIDTSTNRIPFNQQLRNLTSHRRDTLNQKIVLAEMEGEGSAFVTTDNLVDGTHPNAEGDKKMAAIFIQAIEEARAAGFITPPNASALVDDVNRDGLDNSTSSRAHSAGVGVGSNESTMSAKHSSGQKVLGSMVWTTWAVILSCFIVSLGI